MIKRFIRRVLGLPAENLQRVPRERHGLGREAISPAASKVCAALREAGFSAHVVGGAVRDLLLGITPKDFDVATDARPEQIRPLFRRALIIGRRFRLVHVIFQDMIVEVSTFRREPERGTDENADLLVTDDNTFGSPLQDARRRDFTINALFYNIADFSVIDYIDGLDDLTQRRIRVIGDPDLRFREDPVRMMRAIEFASRLDFEIEPATYDAILRHRTEILKASPPRVSEEILELLRRGWSRGAIRLMIQTALLEPLLPEVYNAIRDDRAPYFWKMLEVLDRTVQAGRKISDAVSLSVLFLPWIIEELEKEEQHRDGKMRIGEVILFIRESIQPLCARMALAAGTRHQIEQTLETLWRLLELPNERRSMFRFVFREPFNDALALLELYALSSGRYIDQYRQWQAFAQRAKRATDEAAPQPVRRKRRGKRR